MSINAPGYRPPPKHTCRTYGLVRDRTLVALVVASAWERLQPSIFHLSEQGAVTFTLEGKRTAKRYRGLLHAMRTHLTADTPLDELKTATGVRRAPREIVNQKELAGKTSDY